MITQLDTSGQLGQQDTTLVDDETFLLALTWLEADRKYRDAEVGKLAKARKDAQDALKAKIELPSEGARFRIIKENDRRKAGEPFVIIVDAKAPSADKDMPASIRHFNHRLSINFEDKPEG